MSNRLLWVVTFALASLLAMGGCDLKDQQAVRAADAAWDQAFDNGDVEGVIRRISRSSFEWYDRLARLAREATREQVFALPYSERLEVVMMRHCLNREELRKLDGRGWVTWHVESGPYVSTTSLGFKPSKVVVRKTSAQIRYSYRGKLLSDAVWYVLEDGEWKADYPATAPFHDYRALIDSQTQGISEEKMLLGYLADLTGEYPRESVWDPPR